MIRFVKFGLFSLLFIFTSSIMKVQANRECYSPLSTDLKMVSNTNQTDKRYPQTIIHDIVIDFLSNTNNSKAKKVLVLGYDGFREDALDNILGMKQSAVTSIMKEGGLYHSYAGANGQQETSTAPGWLSILSGRWAYEVGVTNNEGHKPFETTTFLSTATDLGYTSTFLASWAPHFTVTYREDIENSNSKVEYQQMDNDKETLRNLQDIFKDTSSTSFDVVFATLEFTDHAGHAIGYGNHIDGYVKAAQEVDKEAYKVLQTIYERDTYTYEDWLIILTTDHGGYHSNHGGQRKDEKNTWFVMNHPIKICK